MKSFLFEVRSSSALPSWMTGMMSKLTPCTTMWRRQLSACSLSFSGESCIALIRKIRLITPYKMEYSDRITPPLAATSRFRCVSK